MDKILKNLPDKPGIYLFYNKKGLVYVGKASSIKNRVKSYFSKSKKNLRPIEQMIYEVVNIKYIVADSILEAIILEGEYIKKYKPKYNIAWKDDKSWNYIAITKDKYPKVLTFRQHERKQLDKNQEQKMYSHIFGPYPGLKTKAVLQILQRLFYISTCKPNAKRQCLYYQIGQCLGVCTGEITAQEYKQRVIRPLAMFLKGNKLRLIKNLQKQMKNLAVKKEYEEAARIRDQIKSLQKIYDVALLNKSFVKEETKKGRELRIEGYDISNLGAVDKVGSMVVFNQYGPIKDQYRKFNIKSVEGQSDVACLEEVLRRRLKHDEWAMPDIFLIDGGKPQVNRAKKVLNEQNFSIPVIGIAKGPKRDKNQFILDSKNKNFTAWVQNNKMLLIQARDEAHRFAISFNRKKRLIEK